MAWRWLQGAGTGNNEVLPFPNSGIGFLWCPQDDGYHPGGLFASVGQMGMSCGISHNPSKPTTNNGLNLSSTNLFEHHKAQNIGFKDSGLAELVSGEVLEVEEEGMLGKKKKAGYKLKIKVGNQSLRRLISGAIAGAFSRTSVAPIETIRTHMMVGSYGHSTTQVFHNIMQNEGWKGLFRGNLVNVIRVAPSKAI
ncbi:unnamed protein product [Cuscuta epithymum]|uniref:Uncharacterized protein n=1 Tax=Cuscuta epithymum TaxID=186058 RepID=A0AAV0DJ79_9ASTE|nr:unnamed protein product [Cuscuta epithymum]